MAKSDFTFVGSPHDPLSLSGSDPHTGSVPGHTWALGNGARLACWYKIEPGYMLTGSNLWNNSVVGTNHGPGNQNVWTVYDCSGRPESRDRQKVGSHLNVVGNDGYWTYHRPVVSASMIGKGYLGGDKQWFIMGSPTTSANGMWMLNRNLLADSDLDVDNSDSQTWWNTWVSGSNEDGTGSGVDQASWEGYTMFTVMKCTNHNSTYDRPLMVHYGAERNDSSIGAAMNTSFKLGIGKWTQDAWYGNHYAPTLAWNDVSDNASSYLKGVDADMDPGFHQISAWMRRDPGAVTAVKTHLKLFGHGELVGERILSANHGETPIVQGRYRQASIGGYSTSEGAGYIHTYSAKESEPNNAQMNALAEWFAFDNAISDVRRHQLDKYLCDKYGLEMSGTTYLSQMNGGEAGAAQNHAALSNALSGNGTYCRAYSQASTSSAETLIQHETCAGAFLKSTADSGNFYKVQSESAISLRMHVRAESLNATDHTGSHVALVAKATSPFGHQMDHIKGYALKYGTLKDGYDTSDTPKFRLSLRNGGEWLDGKTSESCGDIDLSNDTLGTCAVDTWYTMRLDVIPSGHQFDRIKAYASTNGGGTWLPLKDGSNATSWDITRDSPKYRYWCDDSDFNSQRVYIQNGVHNGYYTALSSSTGHTISTKYYVDGFTAKLDTV